MPQENLISRVKKSRREGRLPGIDVDPPCGYFHDEDSAEYLEHMIDCEKEAERRQMEAYDESTNPSNGWRVPEGH